jgi:hypothetical protein
MMVMGQLVFDAQSIVGHRFMLATTGCLQGLAAHGMAVGVLVACAELEWLLKEWVPDLAMHKNQPLVAWCWLVPLLV